MTAWLSVRELLAELATRKGAEVPMITVEDDSGDRYSLAEWVLDLPVERVVIVPGRPREGRPSRAYVPVPR